MKELTHSPITDEQALEALEKDERKLRFLLPSYALKLRYKLWLVALREVSILLTLTANYDKIPRRSPSWLLVTVFVRFKSAKNLLSALDKRLRKRIY